MNLQITLLPVTVDHADRLVYSEAVRATAELLAERFPDCQVEVIDREHDLSARIPCAAVRRLRPGVTLVEAEQVVEGLLAKLPASLKRFRPLLRDLVAGNDEALEQAANRLSKADRFARARACADEIRRVAGVPCSTGSGVEPPEEDASALVLSAEEWTALLGVMAEYVEKAKEKR